MKRVKVAILGANGHTGYELLNTLLKHPGVEISTITSRKEKGRRLNEVFPRYQGWPGSDLAFSEANPAELVARGVTVAFLALPHAQAYQYALPLLEAGIRVIDLSADFRLRSASLYEQYYGIPHPSPETLQEAVYGLPEIYAKEISDARIVGSAGCYPTSILLPLLPLVQAKLIDPSFIVTNSMSGVSGAGQNISLPYLFVECNESVRAYGAPSHRHLSEIEQELSLAQGAPVTISFTPHLIPVTRGIHTTTIAPLTGTIEEVGEAFEQAYQSSPFVRLKGLGGFPDTKHVTNTNFIDIGWHQDTRTGRLILTSAEDNLGKGAATQAVQIFNLMTKQDEVTGLLSSFH